MIRALLLAACVTLASVPAHAQPTPTPAVPVAECPACLGAQRDLEAAVERMRSLEELNLGLHLEERRLYQDVRNARIAIATVLTPALNTIAQARLAQLERELDTLDEQRKRVLEELVAQDKRVEQARAALAACNRERCGPVTELGRVIGVTGNNPFDPSDPTGPKIVTGQPPVPGAIGSLQFSSASYAGGEGGAVLVTVVRSAGSAGNVAVQYATAPGSAGASDFTAAIGVLSWRDGDMSSKSFSIALANDTITEGPETFSVTLSNPGGGATLGSPSTAIVSISDGSGPPQPAGAIQFSASSFTVAENAGSVTITATRTGGSTGEVTVQYFTGPSSAVAGSDYQAVNGVLSWGVGDMGAKSFNVPIINDTLVEGPESFFVTLNNPTGGATLGAPATSTVTINDDDVNQGPCGPTGNVWTPNAGQYACSGNCSPNPSPRLSINGDLLTATNFHGAPTPATFQGCSQSLTSREGNLTYFGQANHRATITRSSGTTFSANIVSSGGGTCNFTCSRTGP